jgi:ketosteroid isomerase-like protein
VKPAEILSAFLNAYEAKDLDAIALLMTDEVCLQDWNLEARGKAAVLLETKKNFDQAERLQIEVLDFYEGVGCAAARLRITVNRTIELEVVDTIVVDADGKISSIRAYKG